jgi:hypothetical protein
LALIDAEVLRVMVRNQKHSDRPDDLEQRLAVHNACSLARNFLAAGYAVMITDALSEQTTPIYRSLLADVRLRIVHLNPVGGLLSSDDDPAEPRHTGRFPLPGSRSWLGSDETIDSWLLTAEEIAAKIEDLLAAVRATATV